MRPLKYSINVSLDGCCDHQSLIPDPELHQDAAETLARADALIFGRVTYQLMEAGWRSFAEKGQRPEWMDDWMDSFAHTIHHAKKYVVSDSLESVDWNNAELVRSAEVTGLIKGLKQEAGKELYVGGVAFPRSLIERGLIDEMEFIVHPRLVGRGPSLFAGLAEIVDLKLIGRREFQSGAVALRYEPKKK